MKYSSRNGIFSVAVLLIFAAGIAPVGAQTSDTPRIVQVHDVGSGHGRGWSNGSDWHEQMHAWMQQRWRGDGPGYGMGPGMMEPGYGYNMGPGMMGPGYGYGMGPGMMAPGYGYGMGPGMMFGQKQGAVGPVTTDIVRSMLANSLAGNPNLKVGTVEERDGMIIAEVVTKDGSLVNRFRFDPETGLWSPGS